MESFGETERDVSRIRLPEWGRVVEVEGAVAWRVEDDQGQPVPAIHGYLRDLTAQDKAAGTVRSYAFALLRWWRFLVAVGVDWDRARPDEARDFALWMRQATKPVAHRRGASAATVGRTNPITRKRYPTDDYQPATIRHSNAVVRGFYDYWIDRGQGPVINPVQLAATRAGRPHAHHNPLRPFTFQGRLRYNPPMPRRRPRAIPDPSWEELFASMGNNRDRAILSLDISTAARAGELLGMRGADVDWGEQLIRVVRKGTRAQQWLPASPDSFVWLRLYLADIGTSVDPDEPLWRTLRRRGGTRRTLTYDAWRAVLRRANTALGTNWTMHDLRHTCALRMVRDDRLSLRDVQTILGHAHLNTTQTYLTVDDAEVIARVQDFLNQPRPPATATPTPAPGYDPADLAVLLGEAR